ncbi:hypothetical protein ACH5RR_019375 [Cinchona calisaya]|uniref:Endoglucanase n=1 Tax=Cinchona calisaya TaxID=153742 RepID=A0ABD2ZP67_9GENT
MENYQLPWTPSSGGPITSSKPILSPMFYMEKLEMVILIIKCWQRPEDMTTPRTSYKIDEQHPGSDLAGETAAAFAAASLSFSRSNPIEDWEAFESSPLTKRTIDKFPYDMQLFDFATKFPGQYQNSIGVDELLWAAAWLERATQDKTYAEYLNQSSNSGGTRSMLSWDDKYVGVQVLVANSLLEGKLSKYGNLGQYKNNAEQFIRNCIQKGSSNVPRTGGELLWWSYWNNLQYVTSALFGITTYADILTSTHNSLQCPAGSVTPHDLIRFAQTQVDYMLGLNMKNLSYMVGFGSNYPQKVHHRGSSIVSIKKDPTPLTCEQGFSSWYDKDAPNPNILEVQ